MGLLLDFQLIIAGVGGVSPKCSFFDFFVDAKKVKVMLPLSA